jgi:putative spermidine/putrescine transport system substrate-binding protein
MGALIAACGAAPSAGNATTASADPWLAAPDAAKAKEQAADYQTYGMPDDWANYGEVRKQFAAKYGLTFKHADTDMSSLEEITKFDGEKSNPVAVMADIGLLYGPVAEKRGVVPAYLPPEAAKLPANLKAATGGWVATFTGVPAFVVNTDVVKNVPQTWNDLLKPEYKGLIGASNPATSGTGATTFLAWAYAGGGSTADLKPGVEFGKQFVGQLSSAEANAASLEKGEVPIQIKYDFNCVAAAEAVKAKGVKATVIIPGISIYAPSALMLNKYNAAKMDLAKLFSSYVLTDEGQTVFAGFGARPVRYVLGDLKLDASAKTKWLDDAQYAKVQLVDDWTKVDPELIAKTWKDQVLGG